MSHLMSTFPDRFRLDGRTAFITGSGRGLGWEIAKGLAEAGAKVLLHGRSHERLAPRLEQLAAAGHAAEALCFDMADRAAMQVEMSRAGPIDILVHNVGERDRRPFAEIEPDAFAHLIDVDLTAAHALVRLVVPGMIERGWGRLILVTSIVANLAVPGASSYIAAKGGLSALARALAAELGAAGITSNALSPGFFATETNAPMIATPAGERLRERCPAKRWAEPWEIAGAAVFLASPAAAYVNGHTLTVDGGVSATYLA
ncbi:MAG TPA: SDR family oxidoreductase [Reyranella sp.]|nr:SDR family oxidoreductase [Reyranella sp.]